MYIDIHVSSIYIYIHTYIHIDDKHTRRHTCIFTFIIFTYIQSSYDLYVMFNSHVSSLLKSDDLLRTSWSTAWSLPSTAGRPQETTWETPGAVFETLVG